MASQVLRPEDLGDAVCNACGFPLVSEQGLCLRCREHAPAFRHHRSLFLYAGIGKALFRRYKFGGNRRIARMLAPFLENAIAAVARTEVQPTEEPGAELSRPPALVPVPARRSAKRHRAFDPVREVLRNCNGMEIVDCMERRGTKEQKLLSRDDRAANVLNAFFVRDGATVPRCPILVDDVFTTGATAGGCATLLKAAGAEHVDVVTFFMD